ncbi:YifB family Mg chelatase-like AAA ATPase [bacterium]|nr:YifB family Mg chelatase-like AAA ATPase [bacterium]
MLSRTHSFTPVGIDAQAVEVEVDLRSGGQESFTIIVGLPDAAVKESKERLFSAITNAGYAFPRLRTLINLAPADIKKQGPVFDLPMAVGILAALGQVPPPADHSHAFIGELALDGSVRPVKGALAAALASRDAGFRKLVVPRENADEAALVPGIEVHPVGSLAEAAHLLQAPALFDPHEIDRDALFVRARNYDVDFVDVRGQEHAKRAIEVAVAGGHNVLMVGPPGAGKTMLARRVPTIMPEMTLEEAVETTKIHSVRGLLGPDQPLIATRPFRAPHHTISDAGLIGGGMLIEPGEVSLSHNGVLFLDEFPEFTRRALEVLRQPLEDGKVTISRASGTLTFPARFMLIAAMNPCPCGYLGHPTKRCSCFPQQVVRYRTKVSGPLLDRIDLHIEMPAVEYRDLAARPAGEGSAALRARCQQARQRQLSRFAGTKTRCNAHMTSAALNEFCALDESARDVLKMAITDLGFSARAYDRVLRVSRTIADLAGSDCVRAEHVLEAVQYRALDRKYWDA